MKQFFSGLLALISFTAQAQHTGKVRGTVIDGSQKVIESATISLLRGKDSAVVKFAVASHEGQFVFEGIADGTYLVSVSAVGHQKAFSPAFDLTPARSEVELGKMALVPLPKSLQSITVSARKPLIEQKIDRTVVNVEAAATNAGNSALEVLEKSPGITVDKDGNISLKGKQGVMVLVDGRPTQLGGTDLANLLRSMNASQLDQLEIMTNPPAKYDASGNAGVINIKTKKSRVMGYNGSVTLGYSQGVYPKSNEAVNMNYRQGKVNLFANLSHSYRKSFEHLDIQRKFQDKSTGQLASFFDQQARMRNEFSSYSAKAGVDYFASPRTTLGVMFNGFSNPGTFSNRNHNLISNAGGHLVSQTKALSVNNRSFTNFSTNLNFRRLLDTGGKELTADLDYLVYASRTEPGLYNHYFDAGGNRTQKSDSLIGLLPQDITIYSGKMDYLQPMKKGARFEAGVKASIVRTDNNAVYDSIQYGQVVRDVNRSNHFAYEENINAAYINISAPVTSKINGQFGLRLENTIAKGNQITTKQRFERNYTQLFPTVFLQYQHNEKNTIGLNYGKRIRRPNYESLNPFIEFLDRYTYQQGNPNLRPQFSHNIELSHSYKGMVTTTLNYTQTNDIIQQVFEQNPEKNETYVKLDNIARQRQYGISVSAGTPVTKWWTSNLYINAYNNHFEGVVNNTAIEVDAFTLSLNGSQQFQLSKTMSAEVSGYYSTAAIEGVLKIQPMGMMSVGVSQQVLKGKGTLRLNLRDVLQSQVFRGASKFGTIDASFSNRRDTRVINIGFTYRFSKGKLNGAPKRKTGSANEEQNRVGGGNN